MKFLKNPGWEWLKWSDCDYCFQTFGTGSSNNAPNDPVCSYDRSKDQLIITATDPDGDKVRYGVDWNDDMNVDQWTSLVSSGTEERIDCNGRTGSVGVITEDENGAQSNWISVKAKNKPLNFPLFCRFLENHPHIFPLLRILLGLY